MAFTKNKTELEKMELQKQEEFKKNQAKKKILFKKRNKEKKRILEFIKNPIEEGLFQAVIKWNPYNDIAKLDSLNNYYEYNPIGILQLIDRHLLGNWNKQYYNPSSINIDSYFKNKLQKLKDNICEINIFQTRIEINGYIVYIHKVPVENDNLLILLSTDEQILKWIESIFIPLDCVLDKKEKDSSHEENKDEVKFLKVFSKEVLIDSIFEYVSIIPNDLFVDEEIKNQVGRAYYFFIQKEFDASVSHIGKAYEYLIKQMYQFILKKYPNEKLGAGEILKKINTIKLKQEPDKFSNIIIRINDFSPSNKELEKLMGIILDLVELLSVKDKKKELNLSEIGVKVPFEKLVNLKSEISNLDDDKREVFDIITKLIEEIKVKNKKNNRQSTNLIYPKIIDEKALRVSNKRNSVSHHNGKYFQHLEVLEMLTDFLSINFWWHDFYISKENQFSAEPSEIIESIVKFNKNYTPKVF